MKGEKFHVVEWTIENFSCWNREIHDKVITSSEPSLFKCKFELFPTGRNGKKKNLEVGMCTEDANSGRGLEVSFIGSDGSLLCTQQVNLKTFSLFPPGPKFDEVVSRIRKDEALYGDRLTLRFSKFHSNRKLSLTTWKDIMVYGCDNMECMSTTIDAVNIHFKVSRRRSKSVNTLISIFEYPVDDGGRMGWINLISEGTGLALRPGNFLGNFSVRTETFVLGDDGDVSWSEVKEHLFLDYETWTFADSLSPTEEVVLRLRIIPPSNRYRHSVGRATHISGGVTLLPSTVFKFPVSEDYFFKPDDSTAVLKKDLSCLFQDQDFSDFRLKCGDVTFPVHKNILSARSPVFKTMLSTDMRETASGCMDIVDSDSSTLGLFLTYLYTGAVDGMQCDSSLNLYYAADKYQVPSLKKKCAHFLSVNVSVSNVCDILSLADKHRDDQLFTVARNFMLMNYSEVRKSEEWKSFTKREPLLAEETLTHLAEKNRGEVFVHKKSLKSSQISKVHVLSGCLSVLVNFCIPIIMSIVVIIICIILNGMI